ncbi:MAG: arylsulfatase [Phycisphaerae bacterium]|jgi:arylsulfatase A-like enzyme|nr:arylsulfatase [Phycisphaerae bacterium]
MNRRRFLKNAGMLAAGLSLLGDDRRADGADRKALRPNIIYIMADDLGYGHLGCYGQKEIKTPNIDRMAVEGIRLTDHYAGSAVCAPSRSVLLTGLHTGHCFVRNNKRLPVEGNVPIPADSQTFGKVMQSAGYATACIGKWGLGYPGSSGDPTKQGFDHWFGYNCQRQAHSYYPTHLWRNDKKVMLGNTGGAKKVYSHDLLTAEALKFIRDRHKKPFLLYLPYTIPHAQFQVPDLGPYAGKSGWSPVKKAIAAMITRMDRDVGTILKLIKDLGIDNNTLVIFTSDNGSAGGGLHELFKGSGSLRGKKGSLYEGGIRTPFVARWPGKIAKGSVSAHLSAFWDMLPTFAELGGAKVTAETDGISMVPVLLGSGKQTEHEYLYWEFGKAKAVRIGRWKGLMTRGELALYDLDKDIGETSDLSADNPELVKRMKTIIVASHRDTPWTTWKYTGPLPKGQSDPKPKTRKKRKKRKKDAQ